jgi:hypothetical protein
MKKQGVSDIDQIERQEEEHNGGQHIKEFSLQPLVRRGAFPYLNAVHRHLTPSSEGDLAKHSQRN